MSVVIDIAWARPTVAQIKATGATGVLRYFSTDPTKNLTAAEVTAYHAAGLGVGDVWETSTGRATQGYTAGVNDAQAAQAQRSADGLPTDQVVYFAVDEDTSWASVAEYFRGADAVMGSRRDGTKLTGVYGGLRVIDGAAAAGYRFLWQTLAWSGGVRSAHAVLYQDGRMVLSGNADINQVLTPDWGQYPTPNPQPVPTPAPTVEDDMAFEKTIVAGFGADAKGAITDAAAGTVIALPPRNGTYWGAVYVSFASDFADVTLRVAILDAKNAWRVQTVPVKSAGPRVNVSVLDGDQKVSVLRMQMSAKDGGASVPVSCLVEAFRK